MREGVSLLLCLVAGCAVEIGPDGELDPSQPTPPGDPRSGSDDPSRQIPTNGLHVEPAVLARLQTAPLSDAWTAELAATEAGGELLHYVAVCALGGEQSLAGTRGYYGLAPSWLEAPCDGACQRWVSACLLAHANAFDEPVPISPRGAHPGLAQPDAAFGYQEAAFYGNVFTGDEAALEMFACAGDGLFGGEADESDIYLSGRICGVSPACGLVHTGFCSLLTDLGDVTEVTGLQACEVDAGDDGAYADCHVGNSQEVAPRPSPVVAEVITVYLGP